jgi:hypothetical protein
MLVERVMIPEVTSGHSVKGILDDRRLRPSVHVLRREAPPFVIRGYFSDAH